jgi:hypothetical protein
MPFEVPTEQFNALKHAIDKVNQANQFQESIKNQFINAYQSFWGVSGWEVPHPATQEMIFVGQGSTYTVEQMQAILDVMPQTTAINVLTDAAAFVAYLNTAYPNALPERYHTAAFDYTLSESGITLTGLKSVWDKP